MEDRSKSVQMVTQFMRGPSVHENENTPKNKPPKVPFRYRFVKCPDDSKIVNAVRVESCVIVVGTI